MTVDISDPEQSQALIAGTTRQFERVDILVSAAGAGALIQARKRYILDKSIAFLNLQSTFSRSWACSLREEVRQGGRPANVGELMGSP